MKVAMPAERHRPALFDNRDALRGPFTGSLLLHLSLFFAAAAHTYLTGGPRDTLGDRSSAGGQGFVVTPISRIPLPQRAGMVNPVADDSESRVPRPPKPEPKRAVEPDAVAIRGRKTDPGRTRPTPASRYTPPAAQRPNQLYSSTGAAASTPMFGVTGAGGVGLGPASPFGNRFGYYAALIRERVAQRWRTAEVDPRLQAAPTVIVTFDVRRDGSVSAVRMLQRSGNPQLDYSCQRAILEASPFPPLPAGFERDTATVEFWFQLKR
jgi:protein TonB